MNPTTYYVCLLYRMGPLVRYWTMRFEARHNYFKHLAANLGNFINISYTLAMRHQQYQCYLALNTTMLRNEEVEVGPGEIVSMEELGEHLAPANERPYRFVSLLVPLGIVI